MLTKTEYAARKAAIIKEWEGLPGMTAVLIAELDAGQRAAPDPEPIRRTARESEYDSMRWSARLAGHSEAEASRMAQAELDRRDDACSKRHKWCNHPAHNHCVRCGVLRYDHD